MFGFVAVCAVAFLCGTVPAEAANAASSVPGFDWNHILQIVCTALAAYFGSKQNKG